MDTNIQELKKLLKSDLGVNVNRVPVKVSVAPDGTVHRAEERSCYLLHPRGAARAVGARGAELPLEEIVGGEVCSACASSIFGWNSPLAKKKSVVHALTIHRGRNTAKNMVKVNGKTTATAVQGRLAKLPQLVTSIQRVLADQPADVTRNAAEALLSELERAEDALKETSRGEDARGKIERQVKALMLPSRFADQDVNLDRTLLLIGVSPAPSRYSSGNQVRAVIDAYSIRQDTVAVLVAPAFMYAFLLQQLFPKASCNTLVVSTPAPEDADVRAVAAALWDPEGEGALACIQATLTAAEHV